MPRILRSSVVVLLAALGLAWPAAAQNPSAPASLAELQQLLSNHIAQPKYEGAAWGIKIASLQTGKTLFEHNSRKLLSPASNCKLYTVALALDRLGPEYRIRTSVYAKDKPDRRGTLHGDLIVYGRGDPTINARLHGGDILQALQPLVAALTNNGVKRITGDLVGDTSFFRGPEFGSGWAWDDAEYDYGAEISALTINDNFCQLIVRPGKRLGEPCELALWPPNRYATLSNWTETVAKDKPRRIQLYRPLTENTTYVSGQMSLEAPAYTNEVTLHNPAGLFVALFKEALARNGIKLKGKLRTATWPQSRISSTGCAQMVELGSMLSPPLSEIAREIQKPSQNLYTDLLLAQVGETLRTPGEEDSDTSEELGVRELRKFLAEAGVKSGEVFFEEGSGLSRDNLATPSATVTLLQYMHRHRCAQVYLEALPIAGVDGTLRNRMKGTPAAGNVRAKTGSLRWASSLSGYVTTAAGEPLAFSLMVNRYQNLNRSSPARADLDAIAIWLASLGERSGQ